MQNLFPRFVFIKKQEIASKKLKSRKYSCQYSKLENSRLKLLNYFLFCIKRAFLVTKYFFIYFLALFGTWRGAALRPDQRAVK